MDHKLIFKQNQSLNGSLTDYSGSSPVRATIRRNAYDNQSYGISEVWESQGWVTIQQFPIQNLSVSSVSYVARDGEWEALMEADLNELIAYAHEHLALAQGDD